MLPRPVLDAAGLRKAAGAGAFDRGARYARQGSVVETRWEADEHVLHGRVRGSGRQIYSTTAQFSARGGAHPAFGHGRCTCPVGINCKHVVALSVGAPGLFPSPTRFREYYARPIERRDDPELLGRLRRRIRPLMLRRTKEQAAPELPSKQEQVLEVDLHPRHRKLYQTHLQRERSKVLGLVEDMNRNRFTIFRSLTLLRQLSLHAGLVDDNRDSIPAPRSTRCSTSSAGSSTAATGRWSSAPALRLTRVAIDTVAGPVLRRDSYRGLSNGAHIF